MGLLKMDLHVYVYMQRKTFWKGRDQNASIVISAQWDYGRLTVFLLLIFFFFNSEIALLGYLKTGWEKKEEH